MSLITIIVALIILGLLLWVVQLLPIDGKIKQIVFVLVIVGFILWLARGFGFL